jgi:stearoyl-CoA desaturase (delta-9 desaturase)
MFHLSWIGWACLMLGVTQTVILLVTVYFHRAMAHRAVDLHATVLRICRFLAWFLIGMDPKEFAAVHRKHHAHCDTDQDPHSPVRFGWWGVLTRGLALYQREAADPQTIEKYGKGLPNDPWEGFYQRNPNVGILLQGVLWTALLGGQGLLGWGLVLVWIPFWAAGVVNGLGHAFGYRSFDTDDVSTNLTPWGLWIGGEELHNNHHADPANPRFSKAWYELDLGWGVIQALSFFGLARVRQTSQSASPLSDLMRRRYAWLREFRRALNRDASAALRAHGFRRWRKVIHQHASVRQRAQVKAQAALAHPLLSRLHSLDEGLRALWAERHGPEVLTRAFDAWMTEARSLNLPSLNMWCHRLQPA